MASRKASIHFKPVTNVRFAVSHSERTDLSEPSYLLPKEHQLPTVVVDGSLSEHELSARFIARQEAMSRQAKRAGASPFWEGVVVLSDTDAGKQAERLKAWKAAYEKETGHRVLHMSIHLDEGYVDAKGKPHYNPHAHVMVDRLDEKNRFIHLQRKQLSKVQDLTAAALQMQRGSTLAERGGKRGRAHIPHADYRELSDAERLQLGKQAEFYDGLLVGQEARFASKLAEKDALIQEYKTAKAEAEAEAAQELAALAEQYKADRDSLKESGEAKQKDYQSLKAQYEAAKTALTTALEDAEKVKAEAEQAKEQADKLAALAEQYRQERDDLKASGVAKQADYQDLKAQYEAAKAALTTAKAEATQAKAEVEQAKEQADKLAALAEQYRQERDDLKASGVAKQADYQDLKAQYEAAKAALTTAKAEAVEAKAQADQAQKSLRGLEQTLIREVADKVTLQRALKSAKQHLETLETPKAPTPQPPPEKSLGERIRESFEAMLAWIKAQKGTYQDLNKNGGHYIGPVGQLDEHHCVQKIGRTEYAIHRLDELNRPLRTDVRYEEVYYKDGRGQVRPQPEPNRGLGR